MSALLSVLSLAFPASAQVYARRDANNAQILRKNIRWDAQRKHENKRSPAMIERSRHFRGDEG